MLEKILKFVFGIQLLLLVIGWGVVVVELAIRGRLFGFAVSMLISLLVLPKVLPTIFKWLAIGGIITMAWNRGSKKD